jgi:hypothetical protein
MPEPVEPFIQFQLQNASKTFSSLEELEKWIEEESRWWNEIGQKIGIYNRPNASQITAWNGLFSAVSGAISTLKQPRPDDEARQRAYESNITSAKSQIVNVLNANYQNEKVIHSKSATGEFLTEVLEKAPTLVWGLLQGLTVVEGFSTPNNPLDWRGFILGALYRLDLAKKLPSERRAIQKLESEWRDIFEKIRAEQEGAFAATKAHNEAVADQLATVKTEFGTFMEANKSEWEKMRLQFKSELALQAPIQYWRDKAKAHKVAAVWWGIFTLGGAAAAIGGIVLAFSSYLDPTVKLDYEHGALILLLAGFAFFLLRLVSRMFLSSVHMQTDASQRAVMAQTYLALEKEGAAQAESNRAIILEALFRPVTMGVLKEDQTASHPVEAIVAKVTGDSGHR